MVVKQVMVRNETGIHARPASNFITEAKKYKSKITLRNMSRNGTQAVNAKSIMMVLSIAATKDTVVEIAADGEDEEQAVEALVSLVENCLGE